MKRFGKGSEFDIYSFKGLVGISDIAIDSTLKFYTKEGLLVRHKIKTECRRNHEIYYSPTDKLYTTEYEDLPSLSGYYNPKSLLIDNTKPVITEPEKLPYWRRLIKAIVEVFGKKV